MPSESKPKTLTIKRGGKTWKIDPDELRRNGGSVDDKGIRRTTISKDPAYPSMVARQVQQLLKYGFKIESESSFEYVMAMPQKDWEANATQNTSRRLTDAHAIKPPASKTTASLHPWKSFRP
jgi:hypothetical protein